jgi:hypothetical protein
MDGRFNTLKQRHLDFWEKKEVAYPLVGFTIGIGIDSWSYWRDNAALEQVWGKGRIDPEDLDPEAFVEDQRAYLMRADTAGDDIPRTAMPLAAIPWMEAILGCPVVATEAHFASQPILEGVHDFERVKFDTQNPWVLKYREFIETYSRAFAGWHPIGQSVLRGPSDLVCALVGPEKSTLALLDEPEALKILLDRVTAALERFILLEREWIPPFEGGSVIGQYDLWAPGTTLRMQEDFSTLYSPSLYRAFLKPQDERLAGLAEYTLIHLHSTSLFLIEEFLSVEKIRVFQVTKDPGTATLVKMMPALEKIQKAGRCLVLKGRFDQADLVFMKEKLSPVGLCVQPVVDGAEEAKAALDSYRTWR